MKVKNNKRPRKCASPSRPSGSQK